MRHIDLSQWFKRQPIILILILLLYSAITIVLFWPGFYSEGTIKYLYNFQNQPDYNCLNDWRGFIYPCLIKLFYEKDILLGHFFVFQTLFIVFLILCTFWQLQKLSFAAALASLSLFFLSPINFKMHAFLDRNVFYPWTVWAACLCLLGISTGTKRNVFRERILFSLAFAFFLLAAQMRREGFLLLGLFCLERFLSISSKRVKIWSGVLAVVGLLAFSGAVKQKWPSIFLSDQYSLNSSLNTFFLLRQETQAQLTKKQQNIVEAVILPENTPSLFGDAKTYHIPWSLLQPQISDIQRQSFQSLVLTLCVENLLSCVKTKIILFYKFLPEGPMFYPAEHQQSYRFDHVESILESVHNLALNHWSSLNIPKGRVFDHLYGSGSPGLGYYSFWGMLCIFFLSQFLSIRRLTLIAFWPVYAQVLAVFFFGSLGQMRYLYLVHIYFVAVGPLVILQLGKIFFNFLRK